MVIGPSRTESVCLPALFDVAVDLCNRLSTPCAEVVTHKGPELLFCFYALYCSAAVKKKKIAV